MPNFAFSYYGEPTFANPDEGKQHFARYQAWMSSLGDALVNPGTPLGVPRIVSSSGVADGNQSNRLMGFSIVKADSIDAAVEMAKECPYVEHGTIEVAQVMEM